MTHLQPATTEVIKDNQHGEDPDPTPEDQWLKEITTVSISNSF